jgi:hypothetical protein
MDKKNGLIYIISGFVILLFIISNCSAATNGLEISLTGQISWQDIEGGFYGIITPDGSMYTPLNLPDGYKTDGLTVDITGTIPADVNTIQMWGSPLQIKSIKPVNTGNPFIIPWYSNSTSISEYGNKTMAGYLVMVASGLQDGLDKIDRKVASNAENLTSNGTGKDNLEKQLLSVLKLTGVDESCFVDKTGKMVRIVPGKYAGSEGTDISTQTFTSNLLKYPVPAMSEHFSLVEGMDAVVIAYPVYSSDKKVTGYIEAIIDPANLTEVYALPFLKGTEFDLMVVQPDGKILYDAHPDMNGHELWNNSIFSNFPELLSTAAHFQNADAGIDQYKYYRDNSKEIVKTDITWTTVGLHGTPWRICILSR